MDTQKIVMQRVSWNAEAERLLAGATGDDSTYTLTDLRNEVVSGMAELHLVTLGPDKLGYVVLYFEDFGGTRECVLQMGEAFANWAQAAGYALQVIEAYAIQQGAKSMRAHVQKGGRLAALRNAGFRQAEIVVRKGF